MCLTFPFLLRPIFFVHSSPYLLGLAIFFSRLNIQKSSSLTFEHIQWFQHLWCSLYVCVSSWFVTSASASLFTQLLINLHNERKRRHRTKVLHEKDKQNKMVQSLPFVRFECSIFNITENKYMFVAKYIESRLNLSLEFRRCNPLTKTSLKNVNEKKDFQCTVLLSHIFVWVLLFHQ